MLSTKCTASLYVVVAISLTVATAFSTQYFGNTQHAALPKHCHHEELDLAVPVNRTLRPTNIEYTCVAITCRDDYVLIVKHCDRILTPSGCRTTRYDYSKPYPDCCFQVIC